MDPITINVLKKLCEEQIKKGNGEKTIMISNDDEGNGYHYLWFAFSSVEDADAEDSIYENVSKKEDTIILG